jgi:hypothetical protein
MLYAPPVHVLSKYRKIKSPKAGFINMFACPAVNDTFKNVYVIESTIDNEFTVPSNIEEIPLFTPIKHEGKLVVSKPRESALEGYNDIEVNLSWSFFADEPLVARFTAPFFPPFSPAPGVLLDSGEFDIGSWYRPFRLNYNVPKEVSKLTFKENDPLVYVEFKTDKQIVFKRYTGTPLLLAIAQECAAAPRRYSLFRPLKERYDLARKTKLTDQVLAEIKKNVIE